ncbi:MAG: HEPN domain-containing protein [Candidatus Nezhaarchaeales archaeon]
MEEAVKIRIKEELEVAKRRLEAAKLLLEKGMIEDAVNRAYYTFFHAAKAMLNAIGYDVRTHSGLISEFGLRIIKQTY